MRKSKSSPFEFLRFFTKREQEAAKKPQEPLRPFQAVAIFPGTQCCKAAREIEGYRFLMRQAPKLPLSECTQPQSCRCRYLKFNDRRGSPRRMLDFGLKPTLFAAKERRKQAGRRSNDR